MLAFILGCIFGAMMVATYIAYKVWKLMDDRN